MCVCDVVRYMLPCIVVTATCSSVHLCMTLTATDSSVPCVTRNSRSYKVGFVAAAIIKGDKLLVEVIHDLFVPK